MAFSFTERAEYERGFKALFDAEIVPILERHEAHRKVAAKGAMGWMAGAGAAGLGGAGVLYAQDIANFAVGSGFLGVAAPIGIMAWKESKWRKGLASDVMPIACRFLGGMHYGDQRLNPRRFNELGLVSGFDSAHLEDPVAGHHAGFDFALTEARLTRRTRNHKGRRRTTTVFRGVLMRIDLAVEMPAIYFARDRGGVGNWFSEVFSSNRRGREKIEVEDAEFEATYETYADRPEEARHYITRPLTAGLMQVARSETGKDFVAAAVAGSGLYIALPRKTGFLEIGALFKSLRDIEPDMHELLEDLTLPRRVIDALQGPA